MNIHRRSAFTLVLVVALAPDAAFAQAPDASAAPSQPVPSEPASQPAESAPGAAPDDGGPAEASPAAPSGDAVPAGASPAAPPELGAAPAAPESTAAHTEPEPAEEASSESAGSTSEASSSADEAPAPAYETAASLTGFNAWVALVGNRSTMGSTDYDGYGATIGLGGCFCLGPSVFHAGVLGNFEIGIGYQSPDSDAVGPLWTLLRIDVGVALASQPTDDLELAVRYYVISHLNTVREVGSSDDVSIVEPAVRYRDWLLDVGFQLEPFRFPVLTYRNSMADAFTVRARYVFDRESGYYTGLAYEKISLHESTSADEDYDSHVVRLLIGMQN